MSNEKPIRNPDNMEVTIRDGCDESPPVDIILTIKREEIDDKHVIILTPAEARKVVDTLSEWMAGEAKAADYEIVKGGRYVDEDGQVVTVEAVIDRPRGCQQIVQYQDGCTVLAFASWFKKNFKPVE